MPTKKRRTRPKSSSRPQRKSGSSLASRPNVPPSWRNSRKRNLPLSPRNSAALNRENQRTNLPVLPPPKRTRPAQKRFAADPALRPGLLRDRSSQPPRFSSLRQPRPARNRFCRNENPPNDTAAASPGKFRPGNSRVMATFEWQFGCGCATAAFPKTHCGSLSPHLPGKPGGGNGPEGIITFPCQSFPGDFPQR
jgi:hypothetical protein